ncbi:galactose-1-phosphate uridylyltransferase [Aquihabitans sp. McL0605]|uniref:galactose-1-phosphate uridylyltransferase n=1 Tax=Aquihabitans sp. McL0605 TaxID=3415671 RepID=UPI003CF923A5
MRAVNQLRLNPLTGRWVTVSTGRASRPGEFAVDQSHPKGDPASGCPFCPGHEEELPPALETYGTSGAWSLRVVPNKYPAFDGTGEMKVERLGPLFAKAPATGIHEVLVLTPEHEHSWADLDDRHTGLVMSALRDRLEDHAAAAGIRYSQAIVNHGKAAGASLRHPHGQLLGIPFVPGEILEELSGFRRFDGGCLLCATIEAEGDAGHRVVSLDDDVAVIAPWWSGAPFELLVLPIDHKRHLHQSTPQSLVAVGVAVRDALARLRTLLGDVSYNIVFHTLPHRSNDPFHWHAHITPRVHSIGGFEQGTGVPINIVAPEDAAAFLAG